MGWVQVSGVRRALGLSGLALAACLTASAVAALPAQALAPAVARTADAGSGTAAISGTLVIPGPEKAPTGVTVTLAGVPKSGDAITRTAVTKDGAFTFRDLAGGDWVYTITAPYQSTTFSTDSLTVPVGQGLTVKLPLFAPTDSPAKVQTASWTVWLDVTGDKLAVQQDIALTNSGTAAYTGKDPVAGAGDNAKAAVILPTAPQASNFQFLGRFEVCCSASQTTSWAHTRPVNPGGSSGTLRYEAPLVDSLTFTAQFATQALTLLVPEGTTASSPQLTADGTSTDRNVTYQVFKSGTLKAGDTITISLVAPVVASSTPWVAIGLVAAALVAVVVVTWFLLRRRRRAASAPAPAAPAGAKAATVKRAKAKQPRAAKPAVAPKPATTAPPRTQAESLAEQLAQLDVKYENGELSDEGAYRRVRESLVQQLVDAVATDPTSLS
jgi:hypothetical protein